MYNGLGRPGFSSPCRKTRIRCQGFFLHRYIKIDHRFFDAVKTFPLLPHRLIHRLYKRPRFAASASISSPPSFPSGVEGSFQPTASIPWINGKLDGIKARATNPLTPKDHPAPSPSARPRKRLRSRCTALPHHKMFRQAVLLSPCAPSLVEADWPRRQ